MRKFRPTDMACFLSVFILSGCASHIVKDKDAPINYSYAIYKIDTQPVSLAKAFNQTKQYLNQQASEVKTTTSLANYPLPVKPSQFKKVSAGFLSGGFKLDSQGDTIATCKDAVFQATYSVKDVKTMLCVFAYQKGYSVNFITQTHEIDWSTMRNRSVYGAQLISHHLNAKSVSQHVLGMMSEALNQKAILSTYYPIQGQPNNLLQGD
jgi:hypothetical protein